MHTHECHNCGTRWTHGDENYGNVPAHTCATCGHVQWYPTTHPMSRYLVGASQEQKPATTLAGGLLVFGLLVLGLGKLFPKR